MPIAQFKSASIPNIVKNDGENADQENSYINAGTYVSSDFPRVSRLSMTAADSEIPGG